MVTGAHAQQSTSTPAPAFPLNIGTPVEGNLNDDTPAARYTFQGSAGVNVLLLMETTSGDLDPLLVLRGPDGGEIARNDNAEPGVRDAAITTELPVDGTYTVLATRFEQADGTTSGTYGLLLEIDGATLPDGELDPLVQPPSFSVPFTRLNLREFTSGQLTDEQPRQYYAIGGDQSDLLRATLTVTSGDLIPAVRVLNSNLNAIGDTIRPRDGEVIAFGTLPQRDWYLIEVTQQTGTGAFSLFVDALEGRQLTYNNDTIRGEFGVNTPTVPFTFEGTVGDTLFASAVVTEGEATPEIRLLDIALRPLDSASGTGFASLQTNLPRSGTYILQIINTTPNTTGRFNLRFNALQSGPAALDAAPAEYNNSYTGRITDAEPLDYYAFQGRRGDIITAEMTADSDTLDPFLILMDDALNELTVNDNTRGRRDAQIAQFPLPADGTYYLLASRADLANGTTAGDYTLQLTVGAVALTPGSVTVRVRWNTDDDLNLFVREPSGRVISWSNPAPPDSGQLQIDSNTNCTTRSAQPVEYIYWSQSTFPADGDYEVWVWYQQACGQATPVTFSFELAADDETVLEHQAVTLEAGERFNISIRVSQPDVFVLQPGTVTRPTPQQRASEGGDIPLLMGETVTGSISDDVYARFYQFQGQEGDEITLEARAVTGDLDPVLMLRDNTETNLAQADDISRDNRDARLTHTLPYTGRYVVAVTRFGVRDGLTVGDYRLSLRPADAAEYAQAP